jgi:hypothetical protein
MPTIKISDLHPTGAELFSDSESYMNELGDNEINLINGGTGTLIRSVVGASRAVGRTAKRAYSWAARQTPRVTPNIPDSSQCGW